MQLLVLTLDLPLRQARSVWGGAQSDQLQHRQRQGTARGRAYQMNLVPTLPALHRLGHVAGIAAQHPVSWLPVVKLTKHKSFPQHGGWGPTRQGNATLTGGVEVRWCLQPQGGITCGQAWKSLGTQPWPGGGEKPESASGRRSPSSRLTKGQAGRNRLCGLPRNLRSSATVTIG